MPKHPNHGTQQCYVLRQLAFDLALQLATKSVVDGDVEISRTITQLIRSWAEADERVRIHKGKPLPGTLRPTKKGRTLEPRAIPDPVAIPRAEGSGVVAKVEAPVVLEKGDALSCGPAAAEGVPTSLTQTGEPCQAKTA